MTISEVKNDIISDLDELEDEISQYTYLIECAKLAKKYPEQYLSETYKLKECQAQTWIYIGTSKDRINIFIESESLIIKGALSLIAEIYEGRTKEEIRKFRCRLIDYENFNKHFTKEQLRNIKNIIKQIS